MDSLTITASKEVVSQRDKRVKSSQDSSCVCQFCYANKVVRFYNKFSKNYRMAAEHFFALYNVKSYQSLLQFS